MLFVFMSQPDFACNPHALWAVSYTHLDVYKRQERGYVKKMNAKGTIVTEPDDSRVSQLLPNPRRTKEALRYLNSLQLLTLIIHPAALLRCV